VTITIPHMGNVYLAAKALFETLEIPYIIPKFNTKHTMQAGAAVSPEEICLPFKITMGNLLEAIDRGADTVLMVGSCGPCRFGEYCELQMKLLKSLGKHVDFIVIDSPSQIGNKAFWERIGKLSGESPRKRMGKLDALRQAARILRLADETDTLAHFLAGYEAQNGTCKGLLRACKAEAFACADAPAMQRVLLSYREKLKNIRTDPGKNPVRIALTGEIFAMIEPFSNLHIEEKLMDYGVSTVRLLTPSWWLKDLALKPIKLNSLAVKRLSGPYLPYAIGGHARETIAHALMAKANNMDGVIQVFPLGCMPEIVVKSVLPQLSEDHGLPVMTLIVDEMTGEAGYVTRIEAFIDMLTSKRGKGEGLEENA